MYSPRQSRSRHPARHSRHDSIETGQFVNHVVLVIFEIVLDPDMRKIDLHAGLLCHRECMNFDRLRLKYAANGKHQRVTMSL